MRRRNVQHGQTRPMPSSTRSALAALAVLLPLLLASVVGVYAAIAAA
ncbi:hypothetical protein SEA_SADLAD_49 [Microbacterium phage SadLad]|nr:hypothetical protein SEA_RUBYRALPH_47 [Microbacterium phage RubyRalph]QUE25596.1 hypothetical protein SEA_SADLAD_49 [Microbacterium phage SadLad]